MFDDAEVIYVYTLEQALEDGVLVDANEGDLREITTQFFGDQGGRKAPIYMTASLQALIEEAVENEEACNDWKGVWHDVLIMARPAIMRIAAGQNYGVTQAKFDVIITGTSRGGRDDHHELWAGLNERGGMTFMLPEDL